MMKRSNKFRPVTDARCFSLVVACGLALASVSLGAETNVATGMDNAKSQSSAFKRDPFWPVGYVPENVKNDAEASTENVGQPRPSGESNWDAAKKKVVNNGVSARNKEYFAVINGKMKRVGETISVEHEGRVYTWKIGHIDSSGSIKLERVLDR